MRVLFLVWLFLLSGCDLFRPIYYEGTCVNAEGKEITRIVYPTPKWDASSPIPPSCDGRRQITVTRDHGNSEKPE